MQVGDLIKFKGSFMKVPGTLHKDRTGMLVSEGKENWSGWWNILDSKGKMVIWPETEIEVISASR